MIRKEIVLNRVKPILLLEIYEGPCNLLDLYRRSSGFPEDFGELFQKDSRKYKTTMDFAKVNGDLWGALAFSMWQSAVLRSDHEGYAVPVPELDTLRIAFKILGSRHESL